MGYFLSFNSKQVTSDMAAAQLGRVTIDMAAWWLE